MGQKSAFIFFSFLLVLFAPPLLIFVDFFCCIFFSGRPNCTLTKYFYDPAKEMLLAILSICNQKEPVDADAESDEMDTADTTEDLAVRRQIIKNKNLAVGRCGRYSSTRYVFFVYPDFSL